MICVDQDVVIGLEGARCHCTIGGICQVGFESWYDVPWSGDGGGRAIAGSVMMMVLMVMVVTIVVVSYVVGVRYEDEYRARRAISRGSTGTT